MNLSFHEFVDHLMGKAIYIAFLNSEVYPNSWTSMYVQISKSNNQISIDSYVTVYHIHNSFYSAINVSTVYGCTLLLGQLKHLQLSGESECFRYWHSGNYAKYIIDVKIFRNFKVIENSNATLQVLKFCTIKEIPWIIYNV